MVMDRLRTGKKRKQIKLLFAQEVTFTLEL